MKYNSDIHQRRSIRLKGYDYSQAGIYYVTICTKDRECLFGEIAEGKMHANLLGGMIQKWWMELIHRYKNIELDEFIIMPNHIHGIIFIADDCCRGEVSSPLPKTETKTIKKGGETPPLHKNIRKYTLGQIVAFFKYQTTKDINESHCTSGLPLWQRNYYEHIIRNETELNKIREYIITNPLNWESDENYTN